MGEVTAIHGVVVEAVQAQPACVFRRMDPLPPAGSKVMGPGGVKVKVYVHCAFAAAGRNARINRAGSNLGNQVSREPACDMDHYL